MCLTGVDYFSTLGYQPGIAALAAGLLSPIATLILVLLTLFGALPGLPAGGRESPHGEGSIAMLERLLPWWQGKLFVLVLLGFVATDFIITITLSAADATAHMLENPFLPAFLQGISSRSPCFSSRILGGVFLKGFKEAIGIAVGWWSRICSLNAVVVAVGFQHVRRTPVCRQLAGGAVAQYGSPMMMVGVALLVFPEAGAGSLRVRDRRGGHAAGARGIRAIRRTPGGTDPQHAETSHHRRADHERFLMTTSFVTTLLIPTRSSKRVAKPTGRALAFLAHDFFGDGFGTAYDISTILILWFAGASAMAGLLNIVPRYLPRYGMAPDWAHATRPLVLVFTAVAFALTMHLPRRRRRPGRRVRHGCARPDDLGRRGGHARCAQGQQRWLTWAFGVIALVFAYTTVANIVERPDGIKIATFFIAAIVIVSLISRAPALDRAAHQRRGLRRDGGALDSRGPPPWHHALHRQSSRRAEYPGVRAEGATRARSEPYSHAAIR